MSSRELVTLGCITHCRADTSSFTARCFQVPGQRADGPHPLRRLRTTRSGSDQNVILMLAALSAAFQVFAVVAHLSFVLHNIIYPYYNEVRSEPPSKSSPRVG